MYILYLDDSGSVENHNEKVFVLAGIALFERHIYHLTKALDQLACRTGLPNPETLEFHGAEILPGSKRWRKLRGPDKRAAILSDALDTANTLHGDWRLFGAVVDKAAVLSREIPGDPVEVAFSQVVSRFNQFLARTKREGREQRGILVIDESSKGVNFRGRRMSTDQKLKQLILDYNSREHGWKQAKWIIDVPFFVESHMTRAMQYADLVSYAIMRKFEKNDTRFFDVIKNRFDRHGGIVHGLYHEAYANAECDCPYCSTRRSQ